MFTPQKGWSGWSLTPKSGAEKRATGSGSDPNLGAYNSNFKDGTALKGKSVAFLEATPGTGSAVENGAKMFLGSTEANMDRQSLVDRISEIEEELYQYQYNMGLLLIEKKEWTSKYDEMTLELAEAKDALKEGKSAYLIAISEVEKREESLRKALGVEKECVLDLEKALREMRSENAEIKFTADSKLAEANALVASVEEKSLEVEAKLHAADAKLAEMSRKSAEIDRKTQDLEARESALRRDRLSFIAEKETHETELSKQREDLRQWERKLQDGEERLAKGQKILNQREERANENDRVLKQKEKDLEESQKRIEENQATLREKEGDITSRLASIALKEKEYDDIRTTLKMKEGDLLAWEENLNARERDEIQKLLDEHNAALDVKKHEFDMELDEKRKSFEDELKNRLVDVEKKEAEITHKEDKFYKREQAMEKKTEKLREKETEYELKVKSLKEKEKVIRSEEKNLENEKKHIDSERDKLLSLKTEVEKVRVNNEEELLRIHDEINHLKVSEEERLEFLRLQSQLRQEIEQYRHQKELLLKEAEDLKQQKEAFEREWDELDLKRAEIEKESKSLIVQREEIIKVKQSEEERLRNEKMATEDYVQRELESLKLAKESFAAQMEDEKSELAERAQSERDKMLNEFELQKRGLESDMQNQFEEKEKDLREKRKLFEEERERELADINYLREVACREMEDMKLQRIKLEKERQETDENKKHIESQRVEMRKDIDDLVDLSGKLRARREHLMKERDRFTEFVNKLKNCQSCGEIVSDFVLSDLQSLSDIENTEVIPLPKLSNDFVKEVIDGDSAAMKKNSEVSPGSGSRSPASGGTMSWIRKCTSISKIFKFSPVKKIDSEAIMSLKDMEPSSVERANMGESSRVHGTENEAELTFAIAGDSFDVQRIQSDTSVREVEVEGDQSADDQSNINSKILEAPEDSQPSDNKGGRQKPRKRQGRSRVTRTRSVKAVVKDAKSFLGESADKGEYRNGNADDSADDNAEDSAHMNAKSQDQSSKRTANVRKRNHMQTSQITTSELGGDDCEGHSDSTVVGQRKRRRKKAAPTAETTGGARYNLRRPKGGVKAPSSMALSGAGKEIEEVDDHVKVTRAENLRSKGTEVGHASENGGHTHLKRCEKIAGTQDVHGDETNDLVNNVVMSEEVNGTPERIVEHDSAFGHACESHGKDIGEVEDDDDEDEEYQHPGEVSIGKKLWNFLTT